MKLPAVAFTYSDTGFSLEVPNLELAFATPVALIGPNGSGKSTYAQWLAGLLTGNKSNAGEWFYVPQGLEDAFFADNLGQQWELITPGKSFEVLENELEDLGLRPAAFWLRFPLPLMSGGEKRRCALAAALALEPEALILDEPLLGLGGKEALLVIEKIDMLVRMKRRLLLISHRSTLIDRCKELIILEQGKLRFAGRREAYTASLAGQRNGIGSNHAE